MGKNDLTRLLTKTPTAPYSVTIEANHKDAIQKQSLDAFIKEAKSSLQQRRDITLILIKNV